MKVRSSGVALLALCAMALYHLYVVRHGLPNHDPTPIEMIFSLIAVLTGFAGASMAIVGPKLFRQYEWPPRDRN